MRTDEFNDKIIPMRGELKQLACHLTGNDDVADTTVISEIAAPVNACAPMLSNSVHSPRLTVFSQEQLENAPSPNVCSPDGNSKSVICRRAKLRAPIYFNEEGSVNWMIFCALVGKSAVSFPSATPTVPSRTVKEVMATFCTATSQFPTYNPPPV